MFLWAGLFGVFFQTGWFGVIHFPVFFGGRWEVKLAIIAW